MFLNFNGNVNNFFFNYYVPILIYVCVCVISFLFQINIVFSYKKNIFVVAFYSMNNATNKK